MKKHLTKNEILAQLKQAKKIEKRSNRNPFTAMATICNYILWKEELWFRKILAEYNSKVAAYEKQLDAEEFTIKQLSDRLQEKAGFTVEYVEYTEADIKAKKQNKFKYELEKRMGEANNVTNEVLTRYLLVHFSVLMDMGYGKKRLLRNRDTINNYIAILLEDGNTRIMDLHKELYEKAGIDIEMPRLS